jgi:ribonuclease III
MAITAAAWSCPRHNAVAAVSKCVTWCETEPYVTVVKRTKRVQALPAHTLICLDIVGEEKLTKLSIIVGHKFKEPALFAQALTHHSCHLKIDDKVIIQSNEKLEHLGDKVVGLAVCAFLHRRFPEKDEHFFSKIFSDAVSNKLIGEVGEAAGIGALITTKNDSSALQGAGRKKAIADALEAVACALYLDGGSAAVDKFFSKTLYPYVEALALGKRTHDAAKPPLEKVTKKLRPRVLLTQTLHAAGRGSPRYQYEPRAGNTDTPFKAVVWNRDLMLGEGFGKSKKLAADAAAEAALRYLDGQPNTA